MKTMTRQEITKEANALFDDIFKHHGESLSYLKARWQDEREYEDWADYEKAIRDKLKAYNIVKVIKVGAVIRTENFDAQIKVNLRSIGWKVIKLNNVRIAA